MALHRHDATQRRRMASALVGCVLAGALATALMAPLLPDVIEMRSQFAASPDDARGTPRLLSEEGFRLALTLSGSWSAAVAPPLLAAWPGVLLFVIGGVIGWRNSASRVALAAAFAGLPLLVVLAAGGSWTYARFATFIVPGVALAIGVALVALGRRWRRAGIAAAALLAASYVVELALLPQRQPIRDAMDALAQAASPGDRAVDLGIRGNVSAFYAPPNVAVVPAGVLGEALDARLADPRVRWVVVTYPRVLPRERTQTLEATGFSREHSWPGWIDWGRGDVELWRREAPAPPRRPMLVPR